MCDEFSSLCKMRKDQFFMHVMQNDGFYIFMTCKRLFSVSYNCNSKQFSYNNLKFQKRSNYSLLEMGHNFRNIFQNCHRFVVISITKMKFSSQIFSSNAGSIKISLSLSLNYMFCFNFSLTSLIFLFIFPLNGERK